MTLSDQRSPYKWNALDVRANTKWSELNVSLAQKCYIRFFLSAVDPPFQMFIFPYRYMHLRSPDTYTIFSTFFSTGLYEVLQLLWYSTFIHYAFDDDYNIEFHHSVHGVEIGER